MIIVYIHCMRAEGSDTSSLPQEAHCTQLTQDLAKEKDEVSSLNIKVKWAQNKLKAETEAHKVIQDRR